MDEAMEGLMRLSPTGALSSRDFIEEIARQVSILLDEDRHFDKRESARLIGISVSGLQSRLNEIPHFRIGKKILFRKRDLLRWMERNRHHPVDLRQVADRIIDDLDRCSTRKKEEL